jgi:hypothetical protein
MPNAIMLYMNRSEIARQALLPTLKARSSAVMAMDGATWAEQQHRHQHTQRFAQPAPHPGGQAHPYQQAAHSGKGVEAPGDQIVVLGHGVHGKAGKEALIVTTFRPCGLSQ